MTHILSGVIDLIAVAGMAYALTYVWKHRTEIRTGTHPIRSGSILTGSGALWAFRTGHPLLAVLMIANLTALIVVTLFESARAPLEPAP